MLLKATEIMHGEDVLAFNPEHQRQITREVMQKVDQSGFEWAMREHLLEDGDSEYLLSQYQILCDHMNIGKEDLDFIQLKPEYAGMTASELERSIRQKYSTFQKSLVHQVIVSAAANL